jgi:hypothetical protein
MKAGPSARFIQQQPEDRADNETSRVAQYLRLCALIRNFRLEMQRRRSLHLRDSMHRVLTLSADEIDTVNGVIGVTSSGICLCAQHPDCACLAQK